jgi:transposase
MKSYPLKFRQCIVDAVDQQYDTIKEIAALFGVTERYVYKLLQLRKESGDLAPRQHGGGAKTKLNFHHLLKLAELIAKFPDATLEQLRELLRRRCHLNVCTNTVWRGLQQIDFTLKKRTVTHLKRARKSARRFARSK